MAFKIENLKKDHVDPATYSPKYLLHRHLCNREEKRPYGEIHSSDLMGFPDFCAREHVLAQIHNVQRNTVRVATSEAVTFAYGHAVEDLVRNWYADIGRAWGDWRCTACNRLHTFRRRPTKCRGCGCKLLDYSEITFVSKETGIYANPDLFIDFGRPRLTMIEIKSMDKDKLKGLVAPLAEHRWRTNLYMRVIEESGSDLVERIDVERAFVLYVTKGGYGFVDDEVRRWKLSDGDFSPFKEFEIERDDESTEDLSGEAKEVEDWKNGGPVPKGICPTSLAKRAKFCQLHDQCFFGDH